MVGWQSLIVEGGTNVSFRQFLFRQMSLLDKCLIPKVFIRTNVTIRLLFPYSRHLDFNRIWTSVLFKQLSFRFQHIRTSV